MLLVIGEASPRSNRLRARHRHLPCRPGLSSVSGTIESCLCHLRHIQTAPFKGVEAPDQKALRLKADIGGRVFYKSFCRLLRFIVPRPHIRRALPEIQVRRPIPPLVLLRRKRGRRGSRDPRLCGPTPLHPANLFSSRPTNAGNPACSPRRTARHGRHPQLASWQQPVSAGIEVGENRAPLVCYSGQEISLTCLRDPSFSRVMPMRYSWTHSLRPSICCLRPWAGSHKSPRPAGGAGHAREPVLNHRGGPVSRPWAAPKAVDSSGDMDVCLGALALVCALQHMAQLLFSAGFAMYQTNLAGPSAHTGDEAHQSILVCMRRITT